MNFRKRKMEKISLIDRNTVSILLMNAVCAVVLKNTGNVDTIKEVFGLAPKVSDVDVVMTVNGVEVPFSLMVENMVEQCSGRFNRHVEEKAKALVSTAGLDDVMQALERAKYDIEQKIDQALKADPVSEQARIGILKDALSDMLNGWKYIREFHGDLHGVGWNRAQKRQS